MAPVGGLRHEPAPLVLTLEMDGESFAAFDALRRAHYAPERNRVPAHVTLFHHLPAAHLREIKSHLRSVAAAERPIAVAIAGPKAIAHGVAVFLDAPHLHALRERLADEWEPWLEARDQARFRPHVTIRTTESEAEARRTIGSLSAARLPRHMRGIGLHLWRIRDDGTWESVELFRFR
jgi:2'-5' RNA ligase